MSTTRHKTSTRSQYAPSASRPANIQLKQAPQVPQVPSTSSSLSSVLKESLVGGFGSGIGFSLADRIVSGLFGARSVNVVHQTVVNQPQTQFSCDTEEKKLIECHRISSTGCLNEIEAFHKCNVEKSSKTI
jgi:hypothetical protein